MKHLSSMLRIASNCLPVSIKKVLNNAGLERLRTWYDQKSEKTYLISYPKSGRTWLRILIGKTIALYLNKQDENPLSLGSFTKYDPKIPKIIVNHGFIRPGVSTPEELYFDFKQYQSAKIIFLVRHPADVVVSLYYHISKRNSEFNGSISEFIRGRRGGIDTIITYLNAWATALKVPQDLLLVKYENLHSNPMHELERIFNFLGLKNVDKEIFRKAIDYASFQNMRKIEMNNVLRVRELAPADEKDINTYKTRKGEVGGYQAELSEEDIVFLEDKIKRELSPIYGYAP